MKTLIVGCGYLGKIIARELMCDGVTVYGLCRSQSSLKACEALSIIPIQADILRPETLVNLPEVDRLIFCQAPSKNESYQDSYLSGTQNVIRTITQSSLAPSKVLMISSTGVYPQNLGQWVDEQSDIRGGSENSQILLKTEKLVMGSFEKAMILRLSGIYGPGRHRLLSLKNGVIRPDFSDIYTNRIHVSDAAKLACFLLDKASLSDIFLGSDDYPCTQKEFYNWLYEKTKWLTPEVMDVSRAINVPNKRCSNAKIKNMGFKLMYPTFREGYEELLKEAL